MTYLRFLLLPGLLALGLSINGCKPSKKQNAKQRKAGATAVQDTTYDRYWNDVARYLGGMPALPDSKLNGLEQRPEAAAHRQHFDVEWAWKESTLLSRLRKWAGRELPDYHHTEQTVLYPFSGPDFGTIHNLFPNAGRYIMFGLEIEGQEPQVDKIPADRLALNLENLRKSVSANLRESFFYTLDMSVELYRSDLKGTTPILLFMLARTGNEVLDVRRIKINHNAQKEYLPVGSEDLQTHNDTIVTGVEIMFRRSPDAPVQVVEFYNFNADDQHFTRQPHLVSYLNSMRPTVTYFKSASYLLHNSFFNAMRNMVLEVSDVIVQDDTGIGFKYFNQYEWFIRYYGHYTQPIPIFASYRQPGLTAAYLANNAVQPVDFVMGYKSATNLIIARKAWLNQNKFMRAPMRDSLAAPPPADTTAGKPMP